MINLLPMFLISTVTSVQPVAFSTAAILTLDLDAIRQPDTQQYIESQLTEDLQPNTPWGTLGSWRWGIHAGYAEEFNEADNTFGIIGIEFEYFVEDNLSLDLGIHYLDVSQVGKDATGLNATLLMRWHFIDNQTWSMFIEGGAGFLRARSNIPVRGSQNNFTPQAGVGFSFDIDGRNRWLIGLRWYHISNANLYSNNPGRDSLLIWTGISFPF